MKALTLWQPWASLVALGHKKVETRCWKTSYRGELAIHAAAQLPPAWRGASAKFPEFRRELCDCLSLTYGEELTDPTKAVKELQRGIVLCVVRLIGIEETPVVREALSLRELMFGNYEDGRYAWFLEMVDVFEKPIPAKGNRMLWNWEFPK